MKVDLIIIGAGPGGYETALEAAQCGMSVVLFNGDRLGGTCLNEGCIPTKCLCSDAERISQFKNGENFGIEDFTFTVDFNKILNRKNEVVNHLREGIDTLLKRAKVTVVNARASFKEAKRIVANGEEYEADNIIIATGSSTKSLPIPGHDIEGVLDSSALLKIDRIPESLTIIGGGVIGMEFASIFNSLGSHVTVIEFTKHILPTFDTDISKRLKQILTKKGIQILTGASATEILKTENDEMEVCYEVKGTTHSIVSSHVLMAVGRTPNVKDLSLESTGIDFDSKGVRVNEKMQTNVEGVYAIGDVTGLMMLAHAASFQGKRALNAIKGKKDDIRFDLVPSAVFTSPECGMVGMTEEQCKKRGIEISIGLSFYRTNGKALAMGEPEGLCKLIFTKDDNRLIGAHIMGVEAADLTQQCAILMNRDATRVDIENIIFGHPTVSEVILSAAKATK